MGNPNSFAMSMLGQDNHYRGSEVSSLNSIENSDPDWMIIRKIFKIQVSLNQTSNLNHFHLIPKILLLISNKTKSFDIIPMMSNFSLID